MINNHKFISNHWFKFLLGASVLLMIFAVFLFFPKNITRLGLFGFLFLSDYYIWRSYRYWFFSLKPIVKYVFVCLYWLPSVFLVISMIRLFLEGYDAYINPTVYFLSGIIMIVYFIKLIFAFLLMILDVFRFAKYYFNWVFRGKKEQLSDRKKSFVWIAVGTTSLFAFTFFWGGIVDSTKENVNNVVVKSKFLPKSFDGFKIVQISDIHFVSWKDVASFDKIVTLINQQSADIVVFTGDIVTFRSAEAIPFVSSMRKVKAKYGVYSILGNHDYGEYIRWENSVEKEGNMRLLMELYQQAGWKLLANSHQFIVNEANDSLALIGVENWSKKSRFMSRGNIYQAIRDVPNPMFKILLSHDPSHWEILMERKMEFDLTLSGHTHGMQFAIMTDMVNISPISLIQEYWAGLYKKSINNRDCYLYVNTGLGTVSYPSRFGVPPEITVITLNSKND